MMIKNFRDQLPDIEDGYRLEQIGFDSDGDVKRTDIGWSAERAEAERCAETFTRFFSDSDREISPGLYPHRPTADVLAAWDISILKDETKMLTMIRFPTRRERALALYQSGLSLRATAERMGMTGDGVRKLLVSAPISRKLYEQENKARRLELQQSKRCEHCSAVVKDRDRWQRKPLVCSDACDQVLRRARPSKPRSMKAFEAYEARYWKGWPWDRIAKEFGFASTGSCFQTAKMYAKRNKQIWPPPTPKQRAR